MPFAALLERLGLRRPAARAPEPVTEAHRTGPMPSGPVPGSKLTEDFVREVARFAYLWTWPLVNIHNRYWTQDWVKTQTFLIGGVAPVAPVNRLGMLTGSQDPGQRYITCPSQDLIYGFGVLDLARDAVVLQVPDFGTRFFVFQATALKHPREQGRMLNAAFRLCRDTPANIPGGGHPCCAKFPPRRSAPLWFSPPRRASPAPASA